ncbi:MAG: guanylate kinase, partial [Candidatus Aureabacteria bacterium]|nr:guanylate kinase [Candidatus Auribacterota bacterium]
MSNKGLLIVLSAPSGAGKSTICRSYLRKNPGTVYSVSFTTRPPRKGEENGVDYFFVTEDKFSDMVRKNAFLEHAGVFGHRYGTGRALIENALKRGKDVLLDIDVQGAVQLMRKVQGIFIFVLPPSRKALAARLRGRKTDAGSEILKRLKIAGKEISYINRYDYAIINNKLSESLSL